MVKQNNYAVLLYTNLGMEGSMPLLLSAVWLTTAGEYPSKLLIFLGLLTRHRCDLQPSGRLAARQGQLPTQNVHDRLCWHRDHYIVPGSHDRSILRHHQQSRKWIWYILHVPVPGIPGVS